MLAHIICGYCLTTNARAGQPRLQLFWAYSPLQAICQGVEAHAKRTGPSAKVAVDAVFLRRLLAILKM